MVNNKYDITTEDDAIQKLLEGETLEDQEGSLYFSDEDLISCNLCQCVHVDELINFGGGDSQAYHLDKISLPLRAIS